MTDSEELEGVAIVGMGCRFPGAASPEAFWQNLVTGKESITFFDPEDIDPSVDPDLARDPHYVRARGVIEDADCFDAEFFGYSPAEARLIDPQQRLFLEVAWQTLEHAGIHPAKAPSVGVFAGTGFNTYYGTNVLKRPELIDRFGAFPTVTANDNSYLTTRVSHKIGLQGPSLDIQTACSTSLVAVAQAYWALMTYQCDAALAGGSSVDTPLNAGYLYQEGGMFARDGHCRPFDADASGTMFNSGVGVVALKRLEDAVAAGDQIYGVIKGAAVNNDGGDKMSFSAPSVVGQADVVRMALDQADFAADSISYIEAHGTGTPLGDPIEIEALCQTFAEDTDKKQFCGIGSVKSNFGHVVAAAGVECLIKTALALHHKKIPATLHYQRPNPAIDFDQSPFFVVNECRDWQRGDTPRRAGVTSLGVGGTNAHVVLEEWEDKVPEGPSSNHELFVFSAKDPAALERQADAFAAHFAAEPETRPDAAAFVLQELRQHFPHRRAVVAKDAAEAATEFSKKKPASKPAASGGNQRIAFLFSGQGSQYLRMGSGLARQQPVFGENLDRCLDALRREGLDLRPLVYAEGADPEKLKSTDIAQPALFCVEYALARLWESVGITPDVLIGHSIGEFAAACVAGIFTLDDALRIVVERGRLMAAQPPGAMVSVRAKYADIESHLPEGVSIAAINGPQLSVISGPFDAVESAVENLRSNSVLCKPLHTSHAFHSSMMEPAVEQLRQFIEPLQRRAPNIPIVSTVTGEKLSDEEAVSATYWSSQLLQTVRFADAMEWLNSQGDWIAIECGPRSATTQMARQTFGATSSCQAVRSLPDDAAGGETATWLEAVGSCWVAGKRMNWDALRHGPAPRKIPLPTYPFSRTRHWIDIDNRIATLKSTEHSGAAYESTPSPQARQKTQEAITMQTTSRIDAIVEKIQQLFADTAGTSADDICVESGFVEQGFDSLFLTQAATVIRKAFGIDVTFRQLMEDLTNVNTLAEMLDGELPEDAIQSGAATSAPAPAAPESAAGLSGLATATTTASVTTGASFGSAHETLISRQLDLMQQQLAILRGEVGTSAPIPASGPLATASPAMSKSASPRPPAANAETDPARGIRAAARINRRKDDISPWQQKKLNEISSRYTGKTPKSKALAQKHRHHFADPRTVSGFRPEYKEMVYPIVIERSKGSRMWDIDGNEYIDLVNGFGVNMLGNLPDYTQEALREQLELGLEIGPQTALATDVAELFCEITGNQRMAFATSGSEAVHGAMRLARTCTGNDLIVMFEGSYHGIFDEVLVRGSAGRRSLPASPGVPQAAVSNMLVLPFNDMAALEEIRERGNEIAAVLVEPVQGVQPGIHPKEWLLEIRKICTELGAAMICDEVVTGLRVHPRGAQGYFGFEADLSTYGKIVGGGMPIGVIAGAAKFMDALDGGYWSFGDDSIPEVGVTYFAGTFVRHPLAMAAARAGLRFIKEGGAQLQEQLNANANAMVSRINPIFEQNKAPFELKNFGSLMNLECTSGSSVAELFHVFLREQGIHAWHGRRMFLTVEHSAADIDAIVKAVESATNQLMEFVNSTEEAPEASEEAQVFHASQPPEQGAVLVRDANGAPKWVVPDAERSEAEATTGTRLN